MTEISCQVCFEEYKDVGDHIPRILTSCGHSICEGCAKKLAQPQNILCPFDRISTVLTNSNVTSLKKNFAILEAITLTKEQEKLDEKKFEDQLKLKIPCDEDKNHIAVWYCVNCAAHLCQKCSKTIHSPKLLSSHEIVKVNEKPTPKINCPEHSESSAELICGEPSCKISRIMCKNCLFYGKHQNHQYAILEEKYSKLIGKRDEMLKISKKNIADMKIFKEIIQGTIRSQDTEVLNAKSRVDQEYKKLYEELEKQKAETLKEIEKVAKKQIESLEAGEFNVEMKLFQIDSKQAQLEKFTKMTKLEILNNAQRLENICSTMPIIPRENINHNPVISVIVPKLRKEKVMVAIQKKLHITGDFKCAIDRIAQCFSKESVKIEDSKIYKYKDYYVDLTTGDIPDDYSYGTIIYTTLNCSTAVAKFEKFLESHKSPKINMIVAICEPSQEMCTAEDNVPVKLVKEITRKDNRVQMRMYKSQDEQEIMSLIDLALGV